MKSIILSAEQKKVIQKIMGWVNGDLSVGREYITLGGYAGTGKTTLLGVMAEQLSSYYQRIAFACYTGKAARVLRQKMFSINTDYIGTIHGLIYKPIKNEKTGEILSWEKRYEIEQDLIVIDEASMVTADIWNDLLAYGKPVIAVGDHGQLPPVSSDRFNLMENPMLKLETIHRQAEANPILKLATMARTKGVIPVQKYGAFVKKYSKSDPNISIIKGLFYGNYSADTLILCGRNRTRVIINNAVREVNGYKGAPQVGEKVICLKNKRNQHYSISNGMVGIITFITEFDENHYFAKIMFEGDNTEFQGKIVKHQFGKETTFSWDDAKTHGMVPEYMGALFDFGYCLTVHKAQGSQADKVLLFEERNQYQTDEDWRRWLYTAVTRAANELYII